MNSELIYNCEQLVTYADEFNNNTITNISYNIRSSAEKVIKELLQLRELCASAYQVVGAANGPVELLDNLTAAINGDPLPHDPSAGLPWIHDNDRYSDSPQFLVSVCLDGYDNNEEMVKHCGADKVYEALSDYGFTVNFVNKT